MTQPIPEYVTEAERIKQRLRVAISTVEIEAVADQERAAVMALHEQEGTPHQLALDIINLKVLRLSQLSREARQ